MLIKVQEMARNATKVHRNLKQRPKVVMGRQNCNVRNNLKMSVNGVVRPQSLDLRSLRRGAFDVGAKVSDWK